MKKRNKMEEEGVGGEVQGTNLSFLVLFCEFDTNSPPVIDNTSIQCSHGRVSVSKVGSMKRLSVGAWTRLLSKYGGGPTLSDDDLCIECLRDGAKTMVRANDYRDQRSSFKEIADASLAGKSLDGTSYYISRPWLQKWSRRKNVDFPGEADIGPTASIRFPHGGLMPEQAAGAKRVLIPEDLCLFLYEDSNKVKPGDVLGCSTFPSEAESSAICSVELNEVASFEDTLRAAKLKERQNHEKLLLEKNDALNPGSNYLLPSSWLSKWRSYITASGKTVSSPVAARPDPLEGVVDSLICGKHSQLLERPLDLYCKHGLILQMPSTTRNLLRIAIFNISYIRGLFPENYYFNDKSIPALEMKIKKLMPIDAESRRLVDWMEKGVYDALQKKYLKTLLFCISEAVDGPVIEEYAFSFSYSNSDSEEVMMNIRHTENKKQRATFKSNGNIDSTPNQMRSSACEIVRTLVQLMRTLDHMPEERTILMKLLCYEDVTPIDYEPPFFRGCSEQDAHRPWLKNPLKMEIGNVNSKHFVLALKVKSILDPCQDENNDMEDDEEISLCVDEHQLTRLRDWISSRHIGNIDLTDVFSSFQNISVPIVFPFPSKWLHCHALVNLRKLVKASTLMFIEYNKGIVLAADGCSFVERGEFEKIVTEYDYKFPSEIDNLPGEVYYEAVETGLAFTLTDAEKEKIEKCKIKRQGYVKNSDVYDKTMIINSAGGQQIVGVGAGNWSVVSAVRKKLTALEKKKRASNDYVTFDECTRKARKVITKSTQQGYFFFAKIEDGTVRIAYVTEGGVEEDIGGYGVIGAGSGLGERVLESRHRDSMLKDEAISSGVVAFKAASLHRESGGRLLFISLDTSTGAAKRELPRELWTPFPKDEGAPVDEDE